MTSELQAAAHRIVAAMVRDFPSESATIASLVLTEILAVGLHGDDEPAAVAEFVAAVNFKLAEVALHYGADRAWQLVPCDPPRRQ
jgi:hypothetical protein